MRIKLVILGLALLLAGAAALNWSLAEKREEQKQAAFYRLKYASELDENLKQYNEWLQLPPEERSQLPWGQDEYGKTETEVDLRQEQQERLKADLDRLAAGEGDAYPFADILYGENWQEELRKYKSQKEMKEFILAGSIVCIFAGGAIFAWCLLLWTTRLVIRVLSRLKKFFADFFRNREETADKQPTRADAKEDEKSSEHRQKPYEPRNPVRDALRQSSGPLRDKQQIQLKKRSKILISSGWHNFEGSPSEPCLNNSAKEAESAPEADRLASGPQKIAVLLSDENPVESKESLKVRTEGLNLNTIQLNDSAQDVQQGTLEHSEPLGNSLRELTQQVSAIREYACQQQDRVEKLQDGYDWNIIRNFCLRVIRCIDNLEKRINRLSKQDIETVDLKEVRDELLFALESSGVEQFEPEVNSDYRSQEGYAEAVKDREYSEDTNMTGKIAKVIRPGYQYVIDEKNIRVVRAAQVKLYT